MLALHDLEYNAKELIDAVRGNVYFKSALQIAIPVLSKRSLLKLPPNLNSFRLNDMENIYDWFGLSVADKRYSKLLISSFYSERCLIPPAIPFRYFKHWCANKPSTSVDFPVYMWYERFKNKQDHITFEYNGKPVMLHVHTIVDELELFINMKSVKDMRTSPHTMINRLYKNQDAKLLQLIENQYYHVYENNIEFDIPDTFYSDEYVSVIKESSQLIEEGERMNHCAGGVGYIESCTQKKSVFVHIEMNEENATCEYGFADDKWYINEIRGVSNKKVSDEIHQIADDYIGNVNLLNVKSA